MSTVFYNRMKGVADNLLTRFGHSIELIDANRTVLGTYQGLKNGVGSEMAPATVLERSDAVVYITSGTVKPQMGNFLRINNVIYRIIHIDDVEPTDQTLLFKIFISNGAE